MANVHCPFCGGPVHVDGSGQAEPLCPRCGAWVVTGPAEAAAPDAALSALQALDVRAISGPQGEVRFVRAPYAADAPGPWLDDGGPGA